MSSALLDEFAELYRGDYPSGSPGSTLSNDDVSEEPARTRVAIRVDLNGNKAEIEGLSPPIKEWVPQLVTPLIRFARLPENWDSYGARRIEVTRVFPVAFRILDQLGDDLVPPKIFPVNHGGIQLEWRTPSCDVEIEIEPDGRVSIYWDAKGVEEREYEIQATDDGLVTIPAELRGLIPRHTG